MDLDEAEHVQSGDNKESDYSDDDSESVLSYMSQSHPSIPIPPSEPVTLNAVSPMSSSFSNVIMAFSSSGEKEKPKKETITSAISRALNISAKEKKLGKKTPSRLLKFFSKETKDDRAAYL